jgi:hypothetical protein
MLVFWFYSVAHNNLMTNLRLKCKITNSCSHVFWGPVNICICKNGKGNQPKGCQYLCRDQVRSVPSFIKNVVMAAIGVYAKSKCSTIADEMKQSDSYSEGPINSLGTMMMLLGIQQLVFAGFRAGSICFMCLFCCCCECVDEDAVMTDPINGDYHCDRLISFEYEEFIEN